MLTKAARDKLLSLYDVPDPEHPGRTLPGYDRGHAERATRLLLLVAHALGLSAGREQELEVTGLLHDLGRTGMDPVLFARIFSIAHANGMPLRLPGLRAAYPSVPADEAPIFYIKLLRPRLEADGLAVDARVIDHIRMRMDFRGRFREQLGASQEVLHSLGLAFHPWMEKIALYYYYPEEMEGEVPDVRLLGMAQVVCENFEALNNARRGRDYYGRQQERLEDVFNVLAGFVMDGLVSPQAVTCLKALAASGALTDIICESRGLSPDSDLPPEELAYLRALARDLSA